MIAALIFVVSFAVLLQFFVSYSRSLIAAYRKSKLSEQVQDVMGIQGQQVPGEEFGRVIQLVRLCPQKSDDQASLHVVGAYYRMLGILRAAGKSMAPALSSWAEHERVDCTYFAAVALDRCIAYNRDMLAQQMSDH
jgi:hypothetical protein